MSCDVHDACRCWPKEYLRCLDVLWLWQESFLSLTGVSLSSVLDRYASRPATKSVLINIRYKLPVSSSSRTWSPFKLAYSLGYVSIYYGYIFWHKVPQECNQLPLKSFGDILPRPDLEKRWFHPYLTKLSWSFFKQSALKQLLTDGVCSQGLRD